MAKFIFGLPKDKPWSDINVWVTNGNDLKPLEAESLFDRIGGKETIYVIDSFRTPDQLLVDCKFFDSTSNVRRANRSNMKINPGYNHLAISKTAHLFVYFDDGSFDEMYTFKEKILNKIELFKIKYCGDKKPKINYFKKKDIYKDYFKNLRKR